MGASVLNQEDIENIWQTGDQGDETARTRQNIKIVLIKQAINQFGAWKPHCMKEEEQARSKKTYSFYISQKMKVTAQKEGADGGGNRAN